MINVAKKAVQYFFPILSNEIQITDYSQSLLQEGESERELNQTTIHQKPPSYSIIKTDNKGKVFLETKMRQYAVYILVIMFGIFLSVTTVMFIASLFSGMPSIAFLVIANPVTILIFFFLFGIACRGAIFGTHRYHADQLGEQGFKITPIL